MPRTRSSSSSSRRAVVSGQLLGLLDPAAELCRAVAAGEGESGRAQRAGRRRRRVAVGLAGVLADEVAQVLVELEPDASGSTSSTTHSSSPSGKAPPTQALLDLAANTSPSTTTAVRRGGSTSRSAAGDVTVTLTQFAPASAARAPAASTPSSTTSIARPRRRSRAGVAPNDPTLAWKSCSGRSGRGVGGASGSGSWRATCCGCSGRS